MARRVAAVSHDGIAVGAACFRAAMEGMAFKEPGVPRLIAEGLNYVKDARLVRLVNDVAEECHKTQDWRTGRDWIALHHGYEKHPGNCPIVTNHPVVIMTLLMGGDDFQPSITIATSARGDTACNAGNV